MENSFSTARQTRLEDSRTTRDIVTKCSKMKARKGANLGLQPMPDGVRNSAIADDGALIEGGQLGRQTE